MGISQVLPANWPWLAVGLITIYTSYLTFKFIKHRRFYNGLPTPPHSLILGNLAIMGEGMKNYPADIHPQPLFTQLGIDYKFDGIYYLDLYPFSESFIFILDPDLALQVQSQPHLFPRHQFAINFLGGIVGKKSIFSTMGKEWQQQRSWFAPAFSMGHLLTLVPGMIEEVLVFKEKLTKFAVTGDTFVMNDEAMKLAIDLIGRNVGDIKLRSQVGYSPIQDSFSSAIEWTAGVTDPWWKKLLSPVMMRWYTGRLDRELRRVIEKRYKERAGEDGVDKSILDLALRGYNKEKGKLGGEKMVRADLDGEFMQLALDNAKTFFAGGHDTTASLITYMFYYLSINPSILSRVRAEHDQVFGADLESTIKTLTANPALVNHLPFTLAVLKETLRLHPVGFTVREAVPGATITYKDRTYPMEGHMIAVLASSMHRDPALWPSLDSMPLDEYHPDRFLDSETHSSAAWQPFEKGPRNCIGQQLALLEVKVIAVLMVRWFDFEAQFRDHGLKIEGWGGRAYQELKLSAKPKDGIPMVAKLR
ncbi:related to sterigmatocystin biosynthesis P450 monooxygenase STCS [Phialocephala subalpina]|uniref:Related to sterigmatocystin biosynthesis P450 monooxygenase STCS n=1 Tax=Phialocephala subalpina TaxID=576137 RepID=A0A1L7X6R0_9HELO|nr:related to sterigmatocystin biosynthesis P450 monooxygenase STCS [Phialocephala subalpina]